MELTKESFEVAKSSIKAEQEEIERKKKDAEAVFYFQAATDDKIQKAKISRKSFEFAFGIKENNKKLMPELAVAYKQAQNLVKLSSHVRKRKEEFAKLEPTSEQYNELKKSLAKYNMNMNNFVTILMWSAKDDSQDLIHYINDDKKVSKESIDNIRKNAIESATYLFEELDKNNAKPMANELAKGLRTSIQKYSACKSKEDAVKWSAHAEDLLDLFNSHKDLEKESGLSKEELNMAQHIAQMGQTIKKGMQAIEKMAAAALDEHVEIPEEEKLNLMNDVLNMSVAMSIKDQIPVINREVQVPTLDINKQ